MTLPPLRSRMLWRVLLPLALTWLVGSSVALTVGATYTRKAFDRSLLDDARSIAASVQVRNGDLSLALSPREVGAALFDQEEKVFFAVTRPDGSLVAGQGGLREPSTPGDEPWIFEDRHYRGLDLRMVTLWRADPLPFAVVVAQTTRSRAVLFNQLLAASVAPQLVLLLLLGCGLWLSIGRELAPLARLERALDERDTLDLTPILLLPRSRDIAHLAAAFNGLMARIDAGVRAQREFAGDVAHEMRTPLAGVRALAEYGLAHDDPAVWREQLQLIQQSEQRASHLVDQLLALAMANESRDGLALRPVPLDALVRELLVRSLPQADARQVDLGAMGLDQPVWVLGDVALLEGLLGNLLDNALRHGRSADPAAPSRVTVAVVPGRGADAEVLLSVSDNGPGLPANKVADGGVLARWARGPSAAQGSQGAGLGLSIVARYAGLLRARFDIQPAEPGPGLCACVWLRVCEAPAGSPPLTASAHAGR